MNIRVNFLLPMSCLFFHSLLMLHVPSLILHFKKTHIKIMHITPHRKSESQHYLKKKKTQSFDFEKSYSFNEDKSGNESYLHLEGYMFQSIKTKVLLLFCSVDCQLLIEDEAFNFPIKNIQD